MGNVTQSIVLENLNSRIEQMQLPLRTLALLTGISHASLVHKLAGDGDFTVGELQALAEPLQVSTGSLFRQKLVQEKRSCPLEACIAEMHDFENGEQQDPCSHHRFTHDSDKGEYFCEVQKFRNEPWTVHGELTFHVGLDVIDEYRRDYQQALEITDQLNGVTLHRGTEPGVPSVEELAGVGL